MKKRGEISAFLFWLTCEFCFESIGNTKIQSDVLFSLNQKKTMNEAIFQYNEQQEGEHRELCEKLATIIDSNLPGAESKIWHAHPVWFLDGNPICGYSKQKPGIRLMFWSGADFDEPKLNVVGEKFKDASIFYNSVSEIDEEDLIRWLDKGQAIQWDYKNLVKRKGKLEKIKKV